MTKTKRIAIIGAGITAASSVRALQGYGAVIDVFEKSRGAGGRMATRRHEGGMTFDHGAQYFTAQSEAFKNAVGDWRALGLVADWNVDSVPYRISGHKSDQDRQQYVGTPHMNTPVKHEISKANLQVERLVTGIKALGDTVELYANEIKLGTYDYVISTVPVDQVGAILPADQQQLKKEIGAVTVAPCWALMLAFDSPTSIEISQWRGDHDSIAWVAKNSSKPGRDHEGESWTVHARPDWSSAHLERPADDVAADLFAALQEALDIKVPQPAYVTAHRWRYAQTRAALGRPFLTGLNNRLYIGGDWCLGARVEYGFLSGYKIAKAIIAARDGDSAG